MSKILVFILSLATLIMAAENMVDKEPVQSKKAFLGCLYEQDGKNLKPNSMVQVLGNYEECRPHVEAYKTNMALHKGFLLPGAGLVLVGSILSLGGNYGTALTLDLGGIALLIPALVFSSKAQANLNDAVSLYNTAIEVPPVSRSQLPRNGLSIQMRLNLLTF